MKGLIIAFVAFTVISCSAVPTPPVFHAHDGRIHKHSLPAEGLAHRHGNGSAGVIAKSTNRAGSISSSVVYEPSKVVKPNIKSTVANPAKGNAVNRTTKGDASCRQGQANCNVCANNVQQQFSQVASGRINWRIKPWRFTWSKQYPPFGKRPLDIFDGVPAYALGIPDTHVQGFARTNSARYPYVGSHSHKRQGGIFVISQERNGKKYLSTLHPTKSRHPSGVQVIGNYLVYGEQGRLIFKDLNSANQSRGKSIAIPKASFGGGLALLKQAGNNLLLVTTGPGGQSRAKRYNKFYQVQINNNLPSNVKYLGSSAVNNPAQWPKALAFSENLSLITECGTGDIYSIHTTGDQKGVKAISGRGYWRLSKLNQKNGQLNLSPINAFLTRQNMTNCNVRAAATVFVNNRHQLEFNCHGYAKDPDGSMFNVLGRSSRGADKFYFKTGTLY